MFSRKSLFLAAMAGATSALVATAVWAQQAAPAAPPVQGSAVLPPGVIIIDWYKYRLPESAKANLEPVRALIAASDALGVTRDNSYGGATHVTLSEAIDGWEFTGTGTYNGQPAKVVFGMEYRLPGVRMDITRGTSREIIVAARDLAWDESKPGIYSGPAKTSVIERLIPAYLMPGAVTTMGRQAIDKIKLASRNGMRELIIPVPKIGADLRVTLDAKGNIIHTETTVGGKVYSADFSGPWRNDDLDMHVFFPTKVVMKVDNVVTADLTVTEHWSNPYMVWPVPAALKK